MPTDSENTEDSMWEGAPSHISERFEIQQIRQINVPEYAGIIYLNLSHFPLGK